MIWSVVVAVVAGIGLGAIPTVNTMVVQNAVPKRLMGVAMGANFFFIMMAIAISPAILDSARNVTYAKTLSTLLPDGLKRVADEETIASLGDPRVLLSQSAMDALKEKFNQGGSEGPVLFTQTVQAIRSSMEAGLRSVFWIGAITMLLSFLIISTIPESSMNEVHEEDRVAESASAP
jgi:hypothetical protein